MIKELLDSINLIKNGEEFNFAEILKICYNKAEIEMKGDKIMSLSKRIYENNVGRGFKEGHYFFIRSRKYPNGIKVLCERVRPVKTGAILAFCIDENGFDCSFPVSRWAKYHIYEVRRLD